MGAHVHIGKFVCCYMLVHSWLLKSHIFSDGVVGISFGSEMLRFFDPVCNLSGLRTPVSGLAVFMLVLVFTLFEGDPFDDQLVPFGAHSVGGELLVPTGMSLSREPNWV